MVFCEKQSSVYFNASRDEPYNLGKLKVIKSHGPHALLRELQTIVSQCHLVSPSVGEEKAAYVLGGKEHLFFLASWLVNLFVKDSTVLS